MRLSQGRSVPAASVQSRDALLSSVSASWLGLLPSTIVDPWLDLAEVLAVSNQHALSKVVGSGAGSGGILKSRVGEFFGLWHGSATNSGEEPTRSFSCGSAAVRAHQGDLGYTRGCRASPDLQ